MTREQKEKRVLASIRSVRELQPLGVWSGVDLSNGDPKWWEWPSEKIGMDQLVIAASMSKDGIRGLLTLS